MHFWLSMLSIVRLLHIHSESIAGRFLASAAGGRDDFKYIPIDILGVLNKLILVGGLLRNIFLSKKPCRTLLVLWQVIRAP